jgi:hypothetical protein
MFDENKIQYMRGDIDKFLIYVRKILLLDKIFIYST